MSRATIIFLLSVFFTEVVYSQSDNWSYGVNPYYGGVLRYKENMPKLKFTHLHGIELYANKLTTGKQSWHKLYNFPHVGIAAAYYNYGDPKELGEVYSLGHYLDFTSNYTKKHQWRLNIGTGIVYSTRRFHGTENPENKAISSKISYILRGTIHYEYALNDNYFLNLNLGFRHYSNGKLNLPNNGMNYPIVGIGVRYLPNPDVQYNLDVEENLDKNIRFNIMLSTSWREVWQDDFKHRAYSLSIYLSKRINKYNALLLGIDGFQYDKESMIRAMSAWKVNDPTIPDDYELDFDGRQLAITGGTQFYFGKMSVIIQGGVYLYKPQVIYEASWYQRYGLKHYITKKAFAQFTLKTHSRTADLIEFGLGCTL